MKCCHILASRAFHGMLFSVLLILCAGRMQAQHKKPDERLLDTLMTRLVRAQQFYGSLTIGRDEKVSFRFDAPLAGSPGGTRAGAFLCAPLSNPVSTATFLRMIGNGKLHMDDRIVAYLPGFPYERMTIRHLLYQRSGLGDFTKWYFDLWEGKEYTEPADVLNVLEKYKIDLRFDPGTRSEFSSTNYVILVLVAEVVSGKPFAQIAQEMVFGPLRMEQSSLVSAREQDQPGWNTSHGWNADSHAFVPAVTLPGWKEAYTRNGMLHLASDPEDLQRFFSAVQKDWMMPADRDMLLGESGETIPGPGVLQQEDGMLKYHSDFPGYATVAVYVPGAKTWIVSMSDVQNPFGMADPVPAITGYLQGHPLQQPKLSIAAGLATQIHKLDSAKIIGQLEGVYGDTSAYAADEATLLALAAYLDKKKEYACSAAILHWLAKTHPSSSEAHLALGKAISKRGNSRVAKSEFEKALDLDSANYDAQRELRHLSGDFDSDTRYSTEALQEDFDIIERALREQHTGLYRFAGKAGMDSAIAAARAELDHPMTYIEFLRVIAPVFHTLACMHSGWNHSEAFLQYRNANIKLWPLKVVYLGECLYIVQNGSDLDQLRPGTEILAINGVPVDSLFNLLSRSVISDNYSRGSIRQTISNSFANVYANFVGWPEVFDLRVKLPGRQGVSEFSMPALPRQQINRHIAARYPAGKKPIKPLTFEYDPQLSAGTLKVTWFNDEYIAHFGQNFPLYADSLFAAMDTMEIEHLVIDLRGNHGGRTSYGMLLYSYLGDTAFDYMEAVLTKALGYGSLAPYVVSDPGFLGDSLDYTLRSDGLFEWRTYPFKRVNKLPAQRFSGDVYVLVNGETMSSAAIFTSLARDKNRVTVIGEEAGGSYSGLNSGILGLELPNTGIGIYVATRFYKTAVKDLSRHGALRPDYPITPSIEDILSERDAERAFVRKLIESESENTGSN